MNRAHQRQAARGMPRVAVDAARIVRLRDSGLPLRAIAASLGVSVGPWPPVQESCPESVRSRLILLDRIGSKECSTNT